jgi:uncharacterized protein (DUF58 family)
MLFGIASLELRARAIADGVLAGTHASRRFGSSSEFAEHKVYTPGDDLRRLDWKAYARVDRYFVRRYEEVTNLDVAIVVDTSASMAYAGGARGAFSVSKLTCATTLAAALAWLAVEHSDATSLSLFADVEHSFLPPRSRRDHLGLLFAQLEKTKAEGKTNLLDALEQVAARTSRRSLVVVITDMLDVGADALGPLGVLRRRGSDVLVLHVLDRDEVDFPFDGVVRFEDMEGDREVQVDAPLVRQAYLEEIGRYIDGLRAEAGKRDLRYHLHVSDRSPIASLREALGGTRLRGGR